MTMAIPPFTSAGFLPPIRPGATATSPDRSPYPVTIVEAAERFAGTGARRTIFRGFLRLRTALRDLGFTSGNQWLDGSFVEDCEAQRTRPPADMDVVSFLLFKEALPEETSPSLLAFLRRNDALFRPRSSKATYFVDHYAVDIGQPMDAEAVALVTYWYSMWSHTRQDHQWKGFLQVDLKDDDESAAQLLGPEEAPHAP